MATRMEKATSGTVKRAQQRRHFEEWIREEFRRLAIRAQQRGEYGRFRVDSVYFGPDLLTITGDRWTAEAGGDLLRRSNFLNVETYEHADRPGVWVAAGLVR